MKITDSMVENIAWCIYQSYEEDDMKFDSPSPKAKECAHQIAIIAKYGYGDCFTVEEFCEVVDCGGFNSYDGDGIFVDENGNELSGVWEDKEIPENAKYVLWFNK